MREWKNHPSLIVTDQKTKKAAKAAESRYQGLSAGLENADSKYNRTNHLAIYWHVPKCGGTALEDLLRLP
eukprot:5027170-Ditylum_brightwellii.AAC.1